MYVMYAMHDGLDGRVLKVIIYSSFCNYDGGLVVRAHYGFNEGLNKDSQSCSVRGVG